MSPRWRPCRWCRITDAGGQLANEIPSAAKISFRTGIDRVANPSCARLVVRTQQMVPLGSEDFCGIRPHREGTNCQILTTSFNIENKFFRE
jgi:hypothetical protein